MFFIPQHCLLAAACHTCTCPRRQSMLGGGIPLARLSWAEARVKIARMTLTIKLDGNWSSFQLANSAPPLSVTVALLPLLQGCSFSSCSPRSYPTHPLTFPFALAFLQLSFTASLHSPPSHSGNSWSIKLRKNCESHIDASHSRQPLVKGESYEVNAVMILLLKAACLWSCILACVCSHSLCIKLPWPTLLTIRYLTYIYLSVTP